MKRMKKVLWISGLTMLFTSVGAMYLLADMQPLKDIPLQWKPTEDIRTFKAIDLSVYQGVRFFVMPFKDLRKRPQEIGVNIERRHFPEDVPVTTRDDVSQWLTYYFTKTLSDFDITIAKEKTDWILEADILKFFVTEKNAYKAEVALKIRLRDKNDKILWEEMISGEATRVGKSYFDLNYYESLSDAVLYTVHALLQNPSFQQAVKKGASGLKTHQIRPEGQALARQTRGLLEPF